MGFPFHGKFLFHGIYELGCFMFTTQIVHCNTDCQLPPIFSREFLLFRKRISPKVQVCNLMSFEKGLHSCNHNHIKIGWYYFWKIPPLLFSESYHPSSQPEATNVMFVCFGGCFYHEFVFPVPELHINGLLVHFVSSIRLASSLGEPSMLLNAAVVCFFLLLRNFPLNECSNICWCDVLLVGIGLLRAFGYHE